jgi:hypothetical protein
MDRPVGFFEDGVLGFLVEGQLLGSQRDTVEPDSEAGLREAA